MFIFDISCHDLGRLSEYANFIRLIECEPSHFFRIWVGDMNQSLTAKSQLSQVRTNQSIGGAACLRFALRIYLVGSVKTHLCIWLHVSAFASQPGISTR